ncbi:MAG: hypothetical protein H6625_01135 [Bdellovibrionaceae bacterium]|nr:hypothetical protein [Pseudobdellovibrionaceae bacterium]
MTNLLIIMLATLVTKNVMAQTTSLLSCFTGGFAYNNLDITEVGSNLRFTTDGNTLEVNSDKLQPKDQFQMVTFSLPKKDCNLENISENDIVCSADRVIFSIKVYNFERFTVLQKGIIHANKT